MLRAIRKHSKIITFIFAIIIIAFIGQEISIYFLRKEKDKDDIGAVILFDGSEIKYYEYKNRVNRLEQVFHENNVDTNGFLFLTYKKEIIGEMILERGCMRIAKDMHFLISKDEALSLYNDSQKNMLLSYQKRGKDIEKIRERIDQQMNEILGSPVLSSYFIDSEQERNDYRNQEKVKKLIENLSSYPKWKAEMQFETANSFIDIDYFYVLQDKNKDVDISDEEYQRYIDNDIFYKYKEFENYKIKYLKINYPLSENDIAKNKTNLDSLANKFSQLKSNDEVFAQMNSDKISFKKGLKNSLVLDEGHLPDVINSATKKNVGDVFIKIAADSADYNAIYKLVKIDEDEGIRKYHIAVIYKIPVVSPQTKDDFFTAFKSEVADIKTSEQIEDFAKNKKYIIEEKVFLPETGSLRDFEKSREMIVEVNKKCRNLFGKDVFVVEARKQSANCIFGIVSEHVNERMRVTESEKKKLGPELKRKIRNKALLDMMKEKNLLDLSFEELDNKSKDKDFEFLKKGSARVKLSSCDINDFGPVDFSVLRLMKDGSQTGFFETPRGIIKVLIKGRSYEKPNNASFDKFFSEKKKNHKMPSLKKLFEKVYNVKIFINELV